MGTTSVRVEADPDGRRPIVHLSTSGSGAMLRPRLVDLGGHAVRVALVADGALLLSGDEIRIEVVVGSGVHLDLMEPAGTIAYDMRGGSARWDVSLELLPGASIGWHGQPFVVAAGARVLRTTRVSLAADAVARIRETLVLGRSGEGPGELVTTTSMSYGDQAVLVEELSLAPGRPRVGVLGDHRVIDTVYALGPGTTSIDVPAGAQRFELPVAGTMWRSLSGQAHESALEEVWRAELWGTAFSGSGTPDRRRPEDAETRRWRHDGPPTSRPVPSPGR